MDLSIPGNCTKFSCSLATCSGLNINSNLPPSFIPSDWPINEFHVSKQNWRQFFTCHIIHVYSTSIILHYYVYSVILFWNSTSVNIDLSLGLMMELYFYGFCNHRRQSEGVFSKSLKDTYIRSSPSYLRNH